MSCHCNGKLNQLAWENHELKLRVDTLIQELDRSRESLHIAVRLKLKAQEDNDRLSEVLQLAREASNQDLELSRTTSIPYYLESRVANWIRTRIGADHLHSEERAMRLLEEAIELSQAEGITIGQVNRQAAHVYARPSGEASQEAGGVAVCLLGWCAATGHRMLDVALTEIERIEAKPIEQIRGSLARKADDDLVTCGDVLL